MGLKPTGLVKMNQGVGAARQLPKGNLVEPLPAGIGCLPLYPVRCQFNLSVEARVMTPKAASLLAAALVFAGPVRASTYDAICAEGPCTISLDANGIASPAGFIPTARIAQWFTGGQESYSAASGTAGALAGAAAGAVGGGLLLGPIGLLGGLIGGGLAGSNAGKSADLFFNVIGYDQSGQKVTIAFRFVNPKPANKIKTELPMFTGLGMGQVRSVEELRQSKSGSQEATSPAALPENLNSPAKAP